MTRIVAVLAGTAWAFAALPAIAAPPGPAQGSPSGTVTVDALISTALQRVPALLNAQAAARSQRARVGVASAAYLPQITLGAGYARAANVVPAPFNAAPGDGGTANLALHQQLFNFGQTAAQVDAAAASADASDAQARLVAVQIAYSVRQAYLQWAQALGLERAALEQVHDAQALLTQAQSFYRHGARPRIDVTRAAVVAAQAQASLVDARNQVDIARRTLETAIGDLPVAGTPVFPAEPALSRSSAADLHTLARRVHPGLVQGQANLRSARANLEYTDRLRFPSVSLDGLGGARAQELQAAPDWQAGVNLSMPVFTGFSIAKQQESAREAANAAAADLTNRDQQVQLSVDQAYLNIASARQRIVSYRAELASARENYTLAQNRYRSGVGSIIELSDAQAQLATAEADMVRGETILHLAIAALEQAVGLTGLEPATSKGL